MNRISAFETVNNTSFHIGDYDAFKEAAIDLYVSLRNASFQDRKKALEEQKTRSPLERSGSYLRILGSPLNA